MNRNNKRYAKFRLNKLRNNAKYQEKKTNNLKITQKSLQ
jgi:hypothetical protein